MTKLDKLLNELEYKYQIVPGPGQSDRRRAITILSAMQAKLKEISDAAESEGDSRGS